jgi:hypothetical protein
MSHRRTLPAAVAGALLLAGCATSIPPVEVTRFHRIDALSAVPQGSFTVASDGGPSLQDRDYVVAVERELQRLGYRPSGGGRADYAVTVTVDRAERPDDGRGGGVNVGIGGGTGGYRSGVGVGVGLDLTRLLGGRRDLVATRLSVRMMRAGEALALWEGRAETVARVRTPAAQSGIAAEKLARALFADFPGRSGETISVP